jgi:hypothetical protein
LEKAKSFALDIAEGRVQRTKSLQLRTRLESPEELEKIFARAEKVFMI